MKNIVRVFLMSLLVSLQSILPASAGETNGRLSGKIVIEGTGTSQELLRSIARRFEEIHKSASVEVPDSVGSGGGIRAAGTGKAEMGRVARPIKEKEKKYRLIYKVFSITPVVLVVNPSVKGVDSLTAEQIAGIYSGKITNWKQLGGDENKIYPVGRERGDSSRSVLNKKLPDFKMIKKMVSKTIYSDPETANALVKHKYTIGYGAMAMFTKTDLKILKIDGIYPSVENVQKGIYKLTLPLAVVYKEGLSPLASAFVGFLYSNEAQNIVLKHKTIPVKEKK